MVIISTSSIFAFSIFIFSITCSFLTTTLFEKFANPKSNNLVASLNLCCDVGPFITTAIKLNSFLVAVADKLNSASDVEPVLSPVHPE